MKTHKPANISFLILILLFILSQTAFALSAKLVNTADSVEIDQNAETDEISPLLDINNSSPVLSYDSTPFNDIEEIMLEKK